jgi:hypothetical protein
VAVRERDTDAERGDARGARTGKELFERSVAGLEREGERLRAKTMAGWGQEAEGERRALAPARVRVVEREREGVEE